MSELRQPRQTQKGQKPRKHSSTFFKSSFKDFQGTNNEEQKDEPLKGALFLKR
jgi:hypothetical protein